MPNIMDFSLVFSRQLPSHHHNYNYFLFIGQLEAANSHPPSLGFNLVDLYKEMLGRKEMNI